MEMNENRQIWIKMDRNGLDENGWKWLKQSKWLNQPKWPKWPKMAKNIKQRLKTLRKR